jgi:ABC-type bacteriocin/lantibiotic exporter with double-glycine peptidase domain
MIAMTTSNSIKVKASFLLESRGTNQEITGILAPANAQLFTLPVVPVHWANALRIPVPSVIHWTANHYAAILENHGRWFKVVDPTFGASVILRREDILAEASRYFLVPRSQIPAGWAVVGDMESAAVFGRDYLFTA